MVGGRGGPAGAGGEGAKPACTTTTPTAASSQPVEDEEGGGGEACDSLLMWVVMRGSPLSRGEGGGRGRSLQQPSPPHRDQRVIRVHEGGGGGVHTCVAQNGRGAVMVSNQCVSPWEWWVDRRSTRALPPSIQVFKFKFKRDGERERPHTHREGGREATRHRREGG